MKYVMALDAGTGSCRSIIFNDEGKEIGHAGREWSHPTLPQYPGSQVFDTDTNWKLICESIQEALHQAGISPDEIVAVSATSIRFGSVLYDARGTEIWAAPNTDSRADEQVAEAVKNNYFDTFYNITGDGFTICDVMRWQWVKKNYPDVWNAARRFTMISDWILYRLSGRFVSDPSIAASSGLFDIAKRAWSEELADHFAIPLEMAPDVLESGSVVGEVTSKASRETGLRTGTIVVMGGGDTMSGLVGTAGVKKAVSSVIAGTHWQQTYLNDSPTLDPNKRVRISPHMVSDLWMVETNAIFIGMTMRWFRDTFCDSESKLAEAMGVDAYHLMEKMAEKAPVGSNGLIGVFANLFDIKNWVHGASAFMQFDVTSPHKFGKREFIRRIEEDAAFQSLGNLSNIWEAAQFRNDDETEIIFAGGASKGFLWPQIMADVLGMPVKVPVVKEATALGTAFCAGTGAGIYGSIAEAAEMLVKWEKTFVPDKRHHEIYQELYEQWRKVYSHSLEMVQEGTVSPMWKFAGT